MVVNPLTFGGRVFFLRRRRNGKCFRFTGSDIRAPSGSRCRRRRRVIHTNRPVALQVATNCAHISYTVEERQATGASQFVQQLGNVASPVHGAM